MHRRALILFSLVLFLAACDPAGITPPTPTSEPATPTAEATATSEPTATTEAALPTATTEALEPTATTGAALPTPTTAAGGPTATPGGAISAAEQAEVAQVESDTSDLRGLDPKTDVVEKFVPGAQMQANLTDELKQDYTPEESKRDTTTFWLLRLLKDPNTDLLKLQQDLLGEQVLGYYDHKKKELFVRSDDPQLSPLARETLAHEYTHSLQDQYYDLGKLRPDHMENDRGTAVLSLVEGDASISGIAYAKQYMTPADFQSVLDESRNSSTKVIDAAPRYVRDSLLFPYDQSVEFITQLIQAQPGSFKGIDDAFRDPPQSSEQILHPEKYLDKPRDVPVAVTLPPLTSTLGTGWTHRYSDTMGEFDLGEILKDNGVEEPTAAAAAAGWGGGRYSLYQNGDKALVYLGTVWDTAKDATEYNDALQKSFSSMKKDGQLWADDKRFFGLKHSGKNLTLVSGTDRAAVERALAAK
ncbi:MAG: hypothetical protein ACJ78Q_02175 [Chloroflexia bacterium]